MSFTKEEKIILFQQIRDIRKALESIKTYCTPLRWCGQKELDDVIEKLKKPKKRKSTKTKSRGIKSGN